MVLAYLNNCLLAPLASLLLSLSMLFSASAFGDQVPATALAKSSLPITASKNIGLAWHYEKDGRSGTLLGAVHFADSSFYPMPPKIMAAYAKARTLVVEIDEAQLSPEQQQQLIFKYLRYPAGKSLYSELSPKTLALLRALLAEFKLSLDSFAGFRPAMAVLQLTALQAQRLGYSAEQGLDRYFMQKARFNKRIEQIESFEAQMALLTQLPEDDEPLQDSFSNMQAYDEQWHASMNAWKQGDPDALYEATIGSALQQYPELEAFFEILFYERHGAMLDAAEACISQDKGCFYVVGAGHLVGERGLVADLKKLGYRVEQLK